MKSEVLEFFIPDDSNIIEIPLASSSISAGFPSPADDFQEDKISLDKYVVKNKDATFYASLKGTSMIDAGFDEGDILVIDRSLEPTDNKIAVCFVDGDFTVKRVKVTTDGAWLLPYNKDLKPIKITEENTFIIWGIVTYIVKKVI
ncbi:LexA family protein [Moheibacter sp.]|uniref:LexA family protein n=1 Tax=Moheibacter sp. TaxID=1965316 RepID=UPI003C74C4F9